MPDTRNQDLLILTFHSLDLSGGPTSIAPEQFRSLMQELADLGMVAIDLEQWIQQGRPPVPKGFAITFDDGLTSIQIAAEILNRFQFPATMFIVTDRVGKDNLFPDSPPNFTPPRQTLLNWREIKDLSQAGFRVGSHGLTHRSLNKLERDEVINEITLSQQGIENQLQQPCRLFSYPYGHQSPLANHWVSQCYSAGFGVRLGLSTPCEPVCSLSRVDAFYLRERGLVQTLLKYRTGLRIYLKTRRGLRSIGRRTGWSLA